MTPEERIESMSEEEKAHMRADVERVLSKILSKKYEAKITVKFVKKEELMRKHEEEAVHV